MKLIFAQGNPGAKYDGTRHNVGFLMLDRFAAEQGTTFAEKTKFHALIAELTIDGEKVILAKPTTYYNETGRSARALVDFYKLDLTDVLVIHDELSLPFGTVRVRSSGTDAGNNGVKSLNDALGLGYRRIRIAIYTDLRIQTGAMDFVTGRFTREESDALDAMTDHVLSLISSFVAGTLVDETAKL